MLIYKCPKGHRYGVAGFGEDLTQGVERLGDEHECPQCKGEQKMAKAAEAAKEGKP